MFPDFLPYVFPKRYGRILKKICMDFNEDMYGFPGGGCNGNVHPGENELLIALGDGWFCNSVIHLG